eukprot:3648295-Pleurochrysis_carterae.AAC.1
MRADCSASAMAIFGWAVAGAGPPLKLLKAAATFVERGGLASSMTTEAAVRFFAARSAPTG